MDRVRAGKKFFSREKADYFNKNLRAVAASEQRSSKDLETRRMEEYRKLCKREGITSQRLADYDARKEELRTATDDALSQVANDTTLTSSEKRKRAFAIKRKVSTTSLLTEKRTTRFGKMAAAQERRQAEQDELQAQKDQRRQEKTEKLKARSDRNQLFASRTLNGQPKMATRVQDLLRRIEK